MAKLDKKLQANVAGPFYVDATCIDCDTCRWMAPGHFDSHAGQSCLSRQPRTEEEKEGVWRALVACPTASIGAEGEIKPVGLGNFFPALLDGPVYHCGYHASSSFGATPYLIRHDEGNILVDSPRFAAPLVRRLHEMGGLRYLFLTHVDDVADHEKFAREFSCQRIMHKDDARDGLQDIEILIDQQVFSLYNNVVLHHVPGHTHGHMALHLDGKYLFTGDHLAWSARMGALVAFRDYCWHSWSEQISSMERVAALDFEWVLPGHGRMHHADPVRMKSEMADLICRMKANALEEED